MFLSGSHRLCGGVRPSFGTGKRIIFTHSHSPFSLPSPHPHIVFTDVPMRMSLSLLLTSAHVVHLVVHPSTAYMCVCVYVCVRVCVLHIHVRDVLYACISEWVCSHVLRFDDSVFDAQALANQAPTILGCILMGSHIYVVRF